MRRVLDWFFRDRATGRIVIGQWPNVPLWLFLAASCGAWLSPEDSTPRLAFSWLASLSLAWWALDEVVRGVNPWRRCLGGLVLAAVIWGRLAAS
ncbi:hypothetical protein MMB17_12950 [Methylobacterium organophilum]|uniref:hypothetical protein n=1 Tax=Methylobacterium organophilum TaxID=410 RepID=UPI001F12963D|nr:hypothetical protein [Methylobacterium organophilum]UMY15660.1 hypothetical protein MMB17_12950 [Methylobacterium organophilum]